jgi:hypothetical protein
LRVGGEKCLLSAGFWWRDEHGDYVIRSSEFDVIAGGGSFQEALHKFVRGVIDFAAYLGELEDLAENEEEMFHRLAPRIAKVAQEFERVDSNSQRQPIVVSLRRRRKPPEQWHPSSRLHGSRQLSHA